MNRSRIRNIVAIAVAGAIGFTLAKVGGSSLAESSASARPTTTAPFNAAEQRREMIVKLNEISNRLQRVENKLNAGINVKVTEMPAIKVIKDGE